MAEERKDIEGIELDMGAEPTEEEITTAEEAAKEEA